MLKKQLSGLSAQKLRALMIISIVTLIIVACVGFYFVRDLLDSYAAQVRETSAKASASSQNIAILESLKTQLSQDADTVNRTKSIVAESKSYAYQDQIIADINRYAARSGMTIASYGFDTKLASSPSVSGASAPIATAKPANGLKSTNVSVTLKTPVKYTNIVSFVHALEQNLTKMQLAGISLSKDSTSATDLSVSALNLEVYIR